ncbi:MAG: hypothetical protein FWF34_02690, partial [Alphaproteobacteria bacterium]|nr:hypothetical protein [Alphaproteobacteria bacterium]
MMKTSAKKHPEIKTMQRTGMIVSFVAAAALAVSLGIRVAHDSAMPARAAFPDTDFGNFLAAQHAMHVDDFNA